MQKHIMPEALILSREKIIERVSYYGYMEIADILKFMELICQPILENCDYLYIKYKVMQCLYIHDNHSDYFISLRELASELDCFVDYRAKYIKATSRDDTNIVNP